MLALYHKPYQMLSQYNPNPDYPEHRTLPPELQAQGLQPLGRLDFDSEGLLLLSDDSSLEQRLLAPGAKKSKTYLVQVQGTPSAESLGRLREGGLVIRVAKKDHACAPAVVEVLAEEPRGLAERCPAVDVSGGTTWISLSLTEGKNRQVRRMTAKVGHPTLRLIRTEIAGYKLGSLAAGEWMIA